MLWLLSKHKCVWQTTADSSIYSSHFRHHSQASPNPWITRNLTSPCQWETSQHTWFESMAKTRMAEWGVSRHERCHISHVHQPGKRCICMDISQVIDGFISFSPPTQLVGQIPMWGAALTQAMRYRFPVQFTTPLNHASSHNATLCRVLHDSLSASSVPVWPCSPHL